MTALPEDIARFTTDGVEIERADISLKTLFPNATDIESDSFPMFFDNAADGYAMLFERFVMLSQKARLHEAIEVGQSLGLGTTLPIFPYAPRFAIVDESRGISEVAAVRSYAFDMGTDSFSVEVVGLGSLGTPITADTGLITADSGVIRSDQSLT